jgi:nucleoside 2-deoxyribosyltransferase
MLDREARLMVYLAGPITGLSYKGCTGWRQQVKKELEESGHYKAYSPMRGKEFLSRKRKLKAHPQDNTPGGDRLGISSDQAIYRRDKCDVERADIVIFNLAQAETVSIGTMFELAWAEKLGKICLVIMEDKGNCHDHAFVTQAASLVVPTLEDAMEYLLEVYPV